MKKIYQSLLLASVLGASVVGLTFTELAVAEKADSELMHLKPHLSHRQKGPHAMHMPSIMKPFYLANISLTAAQEDKVFALTHASLPDMRAIMKKKQALRAEIRMLVETEQYTENKAREIAKSLASLEVQHVLAKSALGNSIYSLLTEEQKKQFRMAKKHQPNHGGMMPGHAHHSLFMEQDIAAEKLNMKHQSSSTRFM